MFEKTSIFTMASSTTHMACSEVSNKTDFVSLFQSLGMEHIPEHVLLLALLPFGKENTTSNGIRSLVVRPVSQGQFGKWHFNLMGLIIQHLRPLHFSNKKNYSHNKNYNGKNLAEARLVSKAWHTSVKCLVFGSARCKQLFDQFYSLRQCREQLNR